MQRASKSSLRICQKLIQARQSLPDGAALSLHLCFTCLYMWKRISMLSDQKWVLWSSTSLIRSGQGTGAHLRSAISPFLPEQFDKNWFERASELRPRVRYEPRASKRNQVLSNALVSWRFFIILFRWFSRVCSIIPFKGAPLLCIWFKKAFIVLLVITAN